EDRATDRGGDAAGVRQVVVEGDAADVADGLRAVVAAQVQRVAGIPAPGEEAEPVVPHPAPAPHPVDEEQRPPPLRNPRRHALDLEPGDLHRHPARFYQARRGAGHAVRISSRARPSVGARATPSTRASVGATSRLRIEPSVAPVAMPRPAARKKAPLSACVGRWPWLPRYRGAQTISSPCASSAKQKPGWASRSRSPTL